MWQITRQVKSINKVRILYDGKFSVYIDKEQPRTFANISMSHQAKSAECRQQARKRLAELKGVNPSSIPYPRSNVKLSEYHNEIQRLEQTHQAKSAEHKQQAHNEFKEVNSISYPHSNIKFSEYNDKIQLLEQTHKTKSAECRQQARKRLAELKGVNPSSIPYPRSNIKLSEYHNEIQRLEQTHQAISAEHKQQAHNEFKEVNSISYPHSNIKFSEYNDKIQLLEQTHKTKSAECRRQARKRLAELKGVNPNSIPYPRSNIKLSEYHNEIQRLEQTHQAISAEHKQQAHNKFKEVNSISYPHSNIKFSEYNDKIQLLEQTHKTKSAKCRQQARNRLAELKGVNPSSIPYPRSNVKLSEYHNEIQRLEQTHQAISAEHKQQAHNKFKEVNSISYPRSNIKFSEYNDKIQLLEQTHKTKSAECRQQARKRLAELKGVNPSSIPYPRSNIKLSEYHNEIQRLEEIRQQSHIRLAELEELNPSSIPYPCSNIKLLKYNYEIQCLGVAEEEFQKLTKLTQGFNEIEGSKILAISQEIYKFNNENEVQNNEAIHSKQIIVKSNKSNQMKKNYSVARSNKAIVDISYREDKEGKSAFWDHYTFQRITNYPTRVIGTTNGAIFLKNTIKNHAFSLPISPTPPIIGLHPYSSNDFHGLLIIPGSHSQSHKHPHYETRMKNETRLIKDACNRGRPVLGICAGAWKIWELLGGEEVEVYNHKSRSMGRITNDGNVVNNVKMHHLKIQFGSILADAMYGKVLDNQKIFTSHPVANSVHEKAMSSNNIPSNMKIAAWSSWRANNAPVDKSPEENVVEAAETCYGVPMFLIQWHPEAFKANEPDGEYHRNILSYMAKAGDTYYWKQKMLLELKKQYQPIKIDRKNDQKSRSAKKYEIDSKKESKEHHKIVEIKESMRYQFLSVIIAFFVLIILVVFIYSDEIDVRTEFIFNNWFDEHLSTKIIVRLTITDFNGGINWRVVYSATIMRHET